MTELETRLMDALAALSAQWEADQDQQAFEKAGLDERLQELAQQVSEFAGQHEKQAAALQEQLEHVETQIGLLTEQYAIIAADYKALGVCAAGKITSSTSHQMAQNAAEADGLSHHGAFLWHRLRTISHHEVPKSFCGADS